MAPAVDVAIVGYAFKLPQHVDDDTGFWDVLAGRRNLATECPEERINWQAFADDQRHTYQGRRGHFVTHDVAAFDAPFFSVTPREAAAMDPAQRWSLETTYRALEQAGMAAEGLRGSRTAVFSASMVEDYATMVAMDPDNAERTAITGSSVACVIPNRISWFFDLRGPSIHVNTACSSSLSAVDLACKTLCSGDASCAIVTGANLLLEPAMFNALSSMKFLSPDGVCQSFDHRANGYGRGEGVIALVLKPVSAAVRDGDMIRAVIRASGSNQDGHTPGITQPSPQAQEELIQHVYKGAGLSLDHTRYVEAHGTGTAVGDPIEMKAIGRSFRRSRSAEEPLYVGSVKANIGHLEGASGLAGILKCVLMLERGVIPPNALLEEINPAIDVDFYHSTVPSRTIKWPSPGLRRISVNSFGFGGSNTHVVLDDAFHYLQENGLTGNHNTTVSDSEIATEVNGHGNGHANGLDGAHDSNGSAHVNGNSHLNGSEEVACANGTNRTPTNGTTNGTPPNGTNGTHANGFTSPSPARLLIWTAANEAAVKRTMQAYEAFYQASVSGDAAKLDRLALTLANHRSRMLWRSFATVTGDTLSPAKPIRSSTDVGLAFVFTGQGAQYVDMGWDLVQYPVFSDTLKRIDEVYASLGCSWSVFDELRCADNINKPEYSQPLSTAVQIALVELLRTFNIEPKAVVGHSSGEIAAAYTIGGLTLESACKVSYFRGLLAGKLRAENASSPGAMISINLASAQVPAYLEKVAGADGVSVACINSPLNCTLSGPEGAIDRVKAQADTDAIFATKLKTGVAYHSSSMLAIAQEYLALMGDLEAAGSSDPKAAGRIPMVSSVTGKAVLPAGLAKAQYWVDNMVSPVRFADAVQVLTQETGKLRFGLGNITDLVEVGPHPALRRPVLDTVGQEGNRNKEMRYASALQRSRSAVQTALELGGQLFCLGHGVSVSAVNQQSPSQKSAFLVDCPAYPFDHSQRYWAESRISKDFRLRGTVQGEMLGVRSSDWNPMEPTWRNFWSVESTPWIADYSIDSKVVYPAAAMLLMAIEAVQQMEPSASGYLIKTAEVSSLIPINEAWEDRVETQVRLRRSKQGFKTTVYSYSHGEWTECLRAHVQTTDDRDHERVRALCKQLTEASDRPIDSHVMYARAAEHGLQYGDAFQLLQDIHWDGKTTAIGRVDATKHQTRSLVHPALLDQAFHVLRASAGQQPASNTLLRLKDAWFSATGWQQPQTGSIRWLASSTPSQSDTACGETGAVYALADDDAVLCTIGNMVTAGKKSVEREEEKKLMYSIDWKPQLSLLKPGQLASLCRADTYAQDETTIMANHAKLCATLDLVAARTLKNLDMAKVPETLRRHVDWMQHHVAKMTPAQLEQSAAIADADVEAQLCQVEAVLPSWKLYTACARRLPEMLAGAVDPLQVVFESNLADVFYADVFNGLCADGRLGTLLDLAAHETPALRILEVGAGTGGMTTHVLAALQAREARTGGRCFAEYTYTDISPAFFERATGRWAELQAQGRMSFRTCDLDRDTAAQGLEPASYDVVVAACVLHATPDLQATIRNVAKTLKPGGRLILLEVINADDIATNFMAGVLPGWWVAREEWRPHSAAVPESLWDKCLADNGFSGNDMVIRDYANDECHIMSVIVSTKKDERDAVEPTGRLVLLIDEQHESQRELAKAVLSHLDSGPSSIRSFSTDALEDLKRDDIVISLCEAGTQPLMTNLGPDTFACLQLLTQRAPRLLWATMPSVDDAKTPHYGAVQGFLRSIRAEQADSHIVTVSLQDPTDPAPFIAQVFHVAFEKSSAELEYSVRDGLLTIGRAVEDVQGNDALRPLLTRQLKDSKWGDGPALQLSVETPGELDSLRFIRDTTYESQLGSGEVELEARAWGLSSQGADRQLAWGADCAGIVTRTGPDCDALKPGDRVCMVAPHYMRKYPRATASSMAKLPDGISFEVAAAALVPGMTAHHALVDVARLDEGETILIHVAAGSTGQMAVRIAETHGARVFVTAASAEERLLLTRTFNIPEDRILDRKAILSGAGLGGIQVDVVLDPVPDAEMMAASLECMAPGGRYIQAGQLASDSDAALPMAALARSVSVSVIDVTALKPKATARLLETTVQLLADDTMQQPQPMTVFGVAETREALKRLESLGRVVVCPSPDDVVPQFIQKDTAATFDANASYLVAGGFGGVGRAIVRWMAAQGARHLIIPSRSGAASRAARALVADLTARGIAVMAPACDVASEAGLRTTLKACARTMPPIRGCLNAAMVLQDATFQPGAMTLAQWEQALQAKVCTSWNLHRLLPADLDFFVLLSSLAGVLGQMASANYAAGCSFQDALARHREAQGQRGLAVDLGWMRNVGVIAETGAFQRQRHAANDMQQIDEAELFALLALCCRGREGGSGRAQVLFGLRTPAAVRAQSQAPPPLLERPLFGALDHCPSAAATGPAQRPRAADDEAAALFRAATDSAERAQLVQRALAARLARAMSMSPHDVEPHKPLSAYGVDSLMAVDLRNWLARDFGAALAAVDMMGGVPIGDIAELVAARSRATGQDSEQ